MKVTSHKVTFGRIQINVAPRSLIIKERSIWGWNEKKIPLSNIVDMTINKTTERLDIKAKTENFSIYLGGLMTAKLLYGAIQNTA